MIDGTFDVVGAAGPTHFFEQLTAATLSHGYLFVGPAGVGKKTFARRLAQSLLCETPKATLLGYCGVCGGCTRVVGDVHPDLLVAEGQVKIGERESSGFASGEDPTARDLVRQLSLHSYAGGRRIFILGDVEFTFEAANALLKFFEEPPAQVLLLLTSATPARLLPTIRSRLVEVTFPRLGEREVEAILMRHGASALEAEPAARASNGSATRGLALLGGEGSVREAAIEWFFAALAGEAPDPGGWATRPNLEDGLETIKSLLRDWLAWDVVGAGAPLLVLDQAPRIAALPQREPAAIVRALAALGDAERIARTNVTPGLVADLVRMVLVGAAAARRPTSAAS